jgi:TfoX/Sxy family transcriptional regulator of competence genes
MAQGKEFVNRIVELLQPLDIRVKAMFGGYGLYCDEKFVAVIGGDQLYLKQSNADSATVEGTTLAPPYDGAKDYHLVPEALLQDDAWLKTAVQATADALPAPKPKR